jgi:outer membrane protein assembly factor BamB
MNAGYLAPADGLPYRNTYTWYFTLRNGTVTNAIACFDTREFDELWERQAPVTRLEIQGISLATVTAIRHSP